MAEQDKPRESGQGNGEGETAPPAEPPKPADSGGSTATAKPKRSTKRVPKKKPPGVLPPWKVMLHDDPKNSRDFVTATIRELTPLNEQEAETRMMEADKTGVALLLVTHKERAELYKEQFESKGLTVSIEPDK